MFFQNARACGPDRMLRLPMTMFALKPRFLFWRFGVFFVFVYYFSILDGNFSFRLLRIKAFLVRQLRTTGNEAENEEYLCGGKFPCYM